MSIYALHAFDLHLQLAISLISLRGYLFVFSVVTALPKCSLLSLEYFQHFGEISLVSAATLVSAFEAIWAKRLSDTPLSEVTQLVNGPTFINTMEVVGRALDAHAHLPSCTMCDIIIEVWQCMRFATLYTGQSSLFGGNEVHFPILLSMIAPTFLPARFG